VTQGRSRPPLIALVLMGILGLGVVALIGDAVISAFRNVDTAVSVADRPQEQGPSFTEFDDHPLHGELRMPDVTCTLPAFDRSDAGLGAYYAALTACLDQAWQPVLTEAGVRPVSPAVVTANDPVSRCEWLQDQEFMAFYCGADATMYLPVDRMTEWDTGREYLHLATVAHEYAHHVQSISGLYDLIDRTWAALPADNPHGDEFSRRAELQANCFAGVFIGSAADRGSIPRPVASGAVENFVYSTLVSTHGSERNQAQWAARGYRERTLSACDTWSAPADEVSD
jgi:uncharacterized protein